MSPYLALYLGGAAATAFGAATTMSVRDFRTAAFFVLGTVLWPLTVLAPLVQHLSVLRGWFGMTEIKCPACGQQGVARYYQDAVAPPSGWFVVIVGADRKLVLLTCSLPCAARAHEDCGGDGVKWVKDPRSPE